MLGLFFCEQLNGGTEFNCQIWHSLESLKIITMLITFLFN